MVKPSSALSKSSLAAITSEKKMFGLAAQLQGNRDQVLAGVLHDRPGGGLTGERDLGDPVY